MSEVRGVLLALCLLSGCAASSDGRGAPDATAALDGEAGGEAGVMRPDAGRPVPDAGGEVGCEERARWVYTLDRDGTLTRFEPDTLSFTDIGVVSCGDAAGRPFSMAVDRFATAWVLFRGDWRIYHVSTDDASCTPTEFVANQDDFERFGMGFVSDGPGREETLYVAGGMMPPFEPGNARLGQVNPETLELAPVGELVGWPELTGNGAGGLFAFNPASEVFSRIVPATIIALNRDTAATEETFTLTDMGVGDARAWAFAFWGGRFYVFVELEGSTTDVWRYETGGATLERVLESTGRSIVGAGVSTCAPVDLI